MFEKGPRQFYDDTCVVPEKFDGRFFIVLQDFCRGAILKTVDIPI